MWTWTRAPSSLSFQGGLAEPLERLRDVLRRLREHRLEGAEELEMEAGEPRAALGEDGFGHRRQLPGQHERPAHLVRRHLRRRGEGLGHQPGEGPLAQLAVDQAHEELLLVASAAGEEAGEEARPLGGGSGAGDGADPLESRVHLGQGERGLRGGRFRPGVAHGGAAEADPPLAQMAREEGHGDVDLLGPLSAEPAQEIPQSGGLLQAGSGLGDPAGGGDEVGEAHRVSVLKDREAMV